MACKREACAECTRKCVVVHGKKRNSSPVITSFFKVMIGNKYSEVLFLPPKFCPTVSALIGQKVLLEDSSGQQWEVTVSPLNGSLAFQQGWNAFSSHHKLEIGDFLVFHYIMGSHFVVQMYNKTGCEKIDFSLNKNQRKRARTTINFNARDGQYYTTDKDSLNKQQEWLATSVISRSDVEISQSHCEMNDLEKIITKITSNCEISSKSPEVVSKVECFEDPSYLIDRDLGEQGKNRCAVFDLSHFEILENDCGADKSDKTKVVDGHPHHHDTSRMSQIEDVLVSKYPVVEEIVNRVVPSDASEFEILKDNDIEEMKKMATVSDNCNSEFSERLQFAMVTEPEKNEWTICNFSNGVFKRCHIAEEECKAQSKTLPEIEQVMVPQMDCTSFTDINQCAQLKIIEKSGQSSIPVISGLQNCLLGERLKIVKEELVENTPELCSDEQMFQDLCGKLLPLFKAACSQSSDMIVRQNSITKVVKTETIDLVPTSSSTATHICSVITSDSQYFLELPTCLPVPLNKRRFNRERMVVLLRDPAMRMWPVLYHEKSGCKILTSGWEAFSKANNIQLGDECVFGVENHSESIYGVKIVRKILTLTKVPDSRLCDCVTGIKPK